jgi:HEAT repeat protein
MLSLLFAALLAAPGAIAPKAQARQPSAPAADEETVETNDELSDEDVRKHVNGYLGSIDTPIQPNQWKSLGPRAVPILERIATNRQELPTRRAKAIDGLAALGDAKAPALFMSIAGKDGEKINVRFAAVRGLAQVTPRSHAADALKPILEKARDSRVRALAAEQIAIRSRGRACDVVRAQMERENEDARGQYRRAMKQCAPEK